MSAPSHTAARGFYVFQAALGTPLQFHPALGTSELDSLMDAYLPSPASIQDKRASISVDFFDHFRLTGESIKFYQVPDWLSSTTSSPNSAQDSGYGSSFTASPLAPTWSWGPLDTTASTPSTSSSVSTPQITSRKRKQSSSRQSTSSRAIATDFSNLPGMKILTRDGQDVTNTATRGCKTKEQRDHAHLMRIMKACDACKKKKVRCDPSHRSPVSPAEQPRSAKKARMPTPQSKAVAVPSFEPVILENPASLPSLPDSFEFDTFDFLNETPADEQASWDEFLRFNGELDSVFPDGLGDLTDLQPVPPSLPVSSAYPEAYNAPVVRSQDVTVHDVPGLPYMENVQPHDYVDFNLYSPSSSFSDAEPSVPCGLPIDSQQQPSDVNVNERVAKSTVNRPDGYPDTRRPDRSQLSTPLLQTWPSSDHTVASDLGVQIPAPPGTPQREGLVSSDLGHTIPSDGLAPIMESSCLRASRVSVSTPESASNKDSIVSGGESPVLSDSSRSQSLAATCQGDATVVESATQTDAACLRRPGRDTERPADAGCLRRPGGDMARSTVSGEDERGADLREVIEPHRGRPESHASRTETEFSLPKSAAVSVVASSSTEQPRLENLQPVPAERTTSHGQATPAVVAAPLKTTARVTVPSDLGVAQTVASARGNPTGTDCSTTTQSWSLLSVATAVVDMTVATALTCMATSASSDMASGNAMWAALSAMVHTASRGEKTSGCGSSARRLGTRHGVSRMETAIGGVPVVV